MPTRWRRTAGTDCAARALRRGDDRAAVRLISMIAIRARLAAAHADTVAADRRDGLCGACPVSGRRARRGRPISTIAIRVRLAAAHADTVAAYSRDGLCGACPVLGRRARRGRPLSKIAIRVRLAAAYAPRSAAKARRTVLHNYAAQRREFPPSRVRILADGGRRAGRGSRPHSVRKGFPAQALCACYARNAPRNGVKINV